MGLGLGLVLGVRLVLGLRLVLGVLVVLGAGAVVGQGARRGEHRCDGRTRHRAVAVAGAEPLLRRGEVEEVARDALALPVEQDAHRCLV